MKEYIEREAVVNLREEFWKDRCDYMAVRVTNIMNIPATDVAPVVHGKWIMDEYTHRYRCSVCQAFQPYDTIIDYGKEYIDYWDCNHCPICGARMDGGKG